MACSWLLLVSLVSLVSLSTSLTVQAAPAVDDAADRPVPAASPEEFRVARRGPLGSNFIRFGRPVSWNLPREPSVDLFVFLFLFDLRMTSNPIQVDGRLPAGRRRDGGRGARPARPLVQLHPLRP